MNKKNDLGIDFKEIEASYDQIKKRAYDSVVEWHWTKGFFSLEPYYSERNQFPKSKRIKNEPDQKFGHHKQGFDTKGRLVIELDFPFPFLDSVYKETFFDFDRLANCAVETKFGTNKSENNEVELRDLEYLDVFKYENGLLIEQYCIRPTFISFQDYFYDESNRLTEIKSFSEEYGEHVTKYSYDANGELDEIASTNRTYYKKLPRPFVKIAKDVENALYEDVVQSIRNEKIEEVVFSLFLSYPSTGFNLPPELYICTTKDKLRLFNENSKVHIAENELWQDVTEFQYHIYFGEKTDYRELYDLYLQALEMKNQYNKIVGLVVSVAKRLQENKTDLGLEITDDFLVMASDYDMNDTKKNFKKIHDKK